MYAVVGCRDCESLWIVEDRPETTSCPNCRRRYQFERLRSFAETDDIEAARNARTRLLAERSAGEEVASELSSFETMEDAALEAGPTDETYLQASGIDPDRVAQDDESTSGESATTREILEKAIEAAEPPTRERIMERAVERGVSEDAGGALLDELVRRGQASLTDGQYRLL